VKPSIPRARSACCIAAIGLVLLASGAGRAQRVAESGPFGPATLTHDMATGLRWLDVTLSTHHSYSDILAELGPGGMFDGFRLGSGNEVATLLQNAGIDIGTGLFVPENDDPIVALAALVGQTGDDGNCGTGCRFNYTRGWIDNGDPPPQFLSTATLSWFDNSAPLSPSYPQAPIGRALYVTVSDTASPGRGAWLVSLPEPEPAPLDAAAGLALGASAAERRRRARRA
jgi:hypothetical protein